MVSELTKFLFAQSDILESMSREVKQNKAKQNSIRFGHILSYLYVLYTIICIYIRVQCFLVIKCRSILYINEKKLKQLFCINNFTEKEKNTLQIEFCNKELSGSETLRALPLLWSLNVNLI